MWELPMWELPMWELNDSPIVMVRLLSLSWFFIMCKDQQKATTNSPNRSNGYFGDAGSTVST